MKPRPLLKHFLMQSCPRRAVFSLQCRRQASTTILNYTQCHDRRPNQSSRRLHPSNLSFCRASSSAAPRKYPGLKATGINPTPLPPSKPFNVKLNPPPETYAPPLDVPSHKPGQNYFRWLWSCGRAYISFYKTGISNVRATARIAKSLRQKASSGEGDGSLTRAEWQIIRRSRRDIARLPAFAVIMLVFGEWTPVLALWMTPIIPEPCRIPKQVKKEEQKRARRIAERQMWLGQNALRFKALKRSRSSTVDENRVAEYSQHPGKMPLSYVDSMDYINLFSMSTTLSAHSWAWEYFMSPPKSVLMWGLKRKLEYLKKDDSLIERDGGYQNLSPQEVRRACIERGKLVLDKTEAEMRQELEKWYGRRQKK